MLKSFKLSDICDSGSKLSIFTLLDRLDFKDFKDAEETKASFSFRRIFMPSMYEEKSDNSNNVTIQTQHKDNSNNKKCLTNQQTCFCNDLFRKMETKSEISKRFFSLIKPLIVGKIVYAPNTSAAVNELIIRMNTTFSNINQIANLFQKIALISDNILSQLNKFNYFDTLTELKQNLEIITEYSNYAK